MEKNICPICNGIVIYGDDTRDERGICGSCQVKVNVLKKEYREMKNASNNQVQQTNTLDRK
mgnify:CR=1 FL=1